MKSNKKKECREIEGIYIRPDGEWNENIMLTYKTSLSLTKWKKYSLSYISKHNIFYNKDCETPVDNEGIYTLIDMLRDYHCHITFPKDEPEWPRTNVNYSEATIYNMYKDKNDIKIVLTAINHSIIADKAIFSLKEFISKRIHMQINGGKHRKINGGKRKKTRKNKHK